jgi:tryptophan synthase alpha chain
MNRIDKRFRALRQHGKKAFVAYIGAGDPHLEATCALALALDKAGVDILELGVPFSDPLADGPVNQLSAQRGLESGTTPAKVLETVRQIRKSSQIPIVLYIYYNLVYKRRLELFIQDATTAGVDGLLILDLPPEEAEDYHHFMQWSQLRPIFLIAPTTPEARIQQIASCASGFLYYVSREGVTGMQTEVSHTIHTMVAKIRAHTQLPVVIGFGVSDPGQAKAVAALGDGVVVGSAIVNQVAQNSQYPDMAERVAAYVTPMVDAVKSL